MASNRRGPKANCGCCKPPCTCLISKESFRGIVNAIAVSGPSLSIPDRCLAGNYLTGSLSASTTIDYDDGFCGTSTGAGLCPAIQSHYFGPFNITVGDVTSVTKQTWLAGRLGNCLNINNSCAIPDGYSIDCPGSNLCCGVTEYGYVTAYYNYIASAGVGLSYSCLGGSEGTPVYSVYVSAQYSLSESSSAGGWLSAIHGWPVAPTGWTRSSFGSTYTYARNDGKATLTLAPQFRHYIFGKACNGTLVPFSSSETIWQLSAFTLGATNATSVALDYPFDPAGIFAGITGTVT